MNKTKNQQGSALIITLLVITVVSAIVFSTGRLALGELKLTSQLEESDQAYYAAEAGIETGLLMFRFSHDVETSKGATKKDGDPIRFDLTSNTIIPSTPFTPATPLLPPPSEKSVFDLKDWYRAEAGKFVCVPIEACDENGNLISGFTSEKPALAKDETVEYNVLKPDDDPNSGTTIQNLTLTWNPSTTRVEIISIPTTEDIKPEYKFLSIGGEDKYYFTSLQSVNTIRIKAWGGNLDSYVLSTTDSSAKLDSKLITIESTGYFGGAKRKLQITLDRTTGTLLGLHDFTLFGSGSNGITVP